MCEGVRYYAKLAACYDNPYRILKRVGIVAYKLKLPEGTRVCTLYSMFHFSRKLLGTTKLRKNCLQGTENVSQVMVEWQGKGPEEATYDVNMKM
jgi:hypothetical protein